jgi:hypothetical protein
VDRHFYDDNRLYVDITGCFPGVLIVPFTAAAGTVYGAIKAAPTEDVDKADAAGDQTLARLQEMAVYLSLTTIEYRQLKH